LCCFVGTDASYLHPHADAVSDPLSLLTSEWRVPEFLDWTTLVHRFGIQPFPVTFRLNAQRGNNVSRNLDNAPGIFLSLPGIPGSHKRRDKRCHIAAPLLRSALHTCLAAHSISVDETGSSLSHLDEQGLALEDSSSPSEEIESRKRAIDSVEGGDGGEVGIFNINHLGGHRYAGVMLVCDVDLHLIS
jgi:hypothetical protein